MDENARYGLDRLQLFREQEKIKAEKALRLNVM
jgi:hypothetical protein